MKKWEDGHRHVSRTLQSTTRTFILTLSDVGSSWEILRRRLTCSNSFFKRLTLAPVLGIKVKGVQGKQRGELSRLLQ